MEKIKSPDRLNYSVEANQVVSNIDNENFLGLGKSNYTRSKLFLFAMALGVDTQAPTQITSAYTGGFVRAESIDDQTNALMHAFYLSLQDDPKKNVDVIVNKGEVFKTAEEYANTGFKIIEDYMKTNSTHLELTLLEEINEQYEALKEYEK